ncbi:MAG: hypothetical protein ACI8X5_000199 [Planctomycetota bacterium]|jgi:hypothetical protein
MQMSCVDSPLLGLHLCIIRANYKGTTQLEDEVLAASPNDPVNDLFAGFGPAPLSGV